MEINLSKEKLERMFGLRTYLNVRSTNKTEAKDMYILKRKRSFQERANTRE